MLRCMTVAIPRMTSPWKTATVAMAVLGFVWGYTGTAGQPCASAGQCFAYTWDAGPAGFAPPALIPGAIWALVFAALVCVLFLIVYGIRKALPQAPLADTPSPAQPAFIDFVSSPVATAVESHTPASANAGPTAVRIGQAQWARPTPLLLTVAVALAWGILSVGPTRLVSDLGDLIPRDTVAVTAAFCADGAPPSAGRCSGRSDGLPDLGSAPIDYTRMQCVGYGVGVPGPEPDGLCHKRSGGDVYPLIGDVFLGGENGLLAFLAVGAALLLWPRLRSTSLPPS